MLETKEFKDGKAYCKLTKENGFDLKTVYTMIKPKAPSDFLLGYLTEQYTK